ncbi:MAG: hypothetical protein WAL61_10475 [Acidimicrobiales bacterium]
MVPRRTPWLWAFAALALALGLSLPTASPAGAASNGSWSVYPTTLAGQAPRVVFSPELVPGKTIDDSVTVSNLSAATLSFELFAADAFNTPGGGLSLRRRVDPVEGIGAWIHLAHSAIIVPAHQSAAIPFVIVVPTNATPGDHVGGIVAEQTTGTPSSHGSVPVNVVQAVGVRVYGRVTGPLVTHLSVAKPLVAVHRTTGALFGAGTDASVSVRVENRGNVVLTPLAHLKVTSTFGPTTTRTFSTGPLLPGESVARRFTVPVRTTGQLVATLSAVASGAHATAVSSQFNLPWGLVALALVVVVGLVLTLLLRGWRRRRRAKHGAKASGREEDAGDDGVSGDGVSEDAVKLPDDPGSEASAED